MACWDLWNRESALWPWLIRASSCQPAPVPRHCYACSTPYEVLVRSNPLGFLLALGHMVSFCLISASPCVPASCLLPCSDLYTPQRLSTAFNRTLACLRTAMLFVSALLWPGLLVVPRNIFAAPASRPFLAPLLSSYETFSRLSEPLNVRCCLARSHCNSQCWCGRALLQLPCINCCAFRVWTASFRIGEALHPGPCTSLQAGDSVKVAIVNPTAVHRKEADLSSLQAHVLCLSETSAMDAVQAVFARNMASRGYRSYFGAAVAPHSVTLYGVPSAHEDSKSANQYLHTAVLQRLSASKVPTLVAGDLNVRVQSLPVWEEYCKLGFHEIHELVPVRLGLHLPATCKGATYHDTALLNEPLLGLLQHAVVLEQDFLFDAHSPLLLHFRCPDSLPLRKRWRQPQSWLDFDIQADSFSQAYSEVAPQVEAALDTVTSLDAAADAFAFWADRVEHSVHSAIQAQHRADPLAFPCNKLPRRCRGRCRPVKLVGRPCPQLPRAPRCGDQHLGPHAHSASF